MGTAAAGLPNIPCVVLAGGRSSRFGSTKGVAELGGAPLVQHVIERLKAQSAGPIIINAPGDGTYSWLANDVAPDVLDGNFGPLSGIYSAMCWAKSHGFEEVITVPVDTPFFPKDLIARLIGEGAPAIARTDAGLHPVFGLWPVALEGSLRQTIEHGTLAVHKWAQTSGAREVSFNSDADIDPFFNINTPRNLETAVAYSEGTSTTEH